MTAFNAILIIWVVSFIALAMAYLDVRRVLRGNIRAFTGAIDRTSSDTVLKHCRITQA